MTETKNVRGDRNHPFYKDNEMVGKLKTKKLVGAVLVLQILKQKVGSQNGIYL